MKRHLNTSYRLVWNHITGAFVVASELARARGKRAGVAVALSLAAATSLPALAADSVVPAGEPGVAFTSTRAAREWLILNMAGLEREEFRVLYLNNQNQLIAGETLFTGTINRTEVHPREVIKRALYHNAAAVVLAHNHPSGEVTPSKADRLITERLVQALGLVDIRVPDHLIVGGSQVFSFAEHGLL